MILNNVFMGLTNPLLVSNYNIYGIKVEIVIHIIKWDWHPPQDSPAVSIGDARCTLTSSGWCLQVPHQLRQLFRIRVIQQLALTEQAVRRAGKAWYVLPIRGGAGSVRGVHRWKPNHYQVGN